MNVYEKLCLKNILSENTYPGRGIVIGKSEDGKKAVTAYFIMGRSENSRNRIFTQNGEDITIYPFDESKVEDPSLIIYSPVRKIGDSLIVTNGDQTDTIYDFIKAGKTFEEALRTREFEPDAPNFTPRISGILNFKDNDFTYKMSILKSGDENGTICNRYTFDYNSFSGVGHFIHTYHKDGNPIPTFLGEPERVAIKGDIDEFTNMIWENLNQDNKISLFVRFVDLETGEASSRMINKHGGEKA
ncbi:MAG: IMP cyclohydrolase [Clostridia bacterium]|nr:IMP cyclohydrolase [Clostridia bacterium]